MKARGIALGRMDSCRRGADAVRSHTANTAGPGPDPPRPPGGGRGRKRGALGHTYRHYRHYYTVSPVLPRRVFRSVTAVTAVTVLPAGVGRTPPLAKPVGQSIHDLICGVRNETQHIVLVL